jgi:hypothetical protein
MDKCVICGKPGAYKVKEVTAADVQVETITATAGLVEAQLQVETITCTAGESTGAGNITMTITSAGMTNSPKDVIVPVVESDDVDAVGLALRTALEADEDVISFFTVSGATDSAILTAITAAADDATLAFGFVDTDTTGVTFGASTNTTAGAADLAGNITMTITSANLTGSPLAIVIALDDEYTVTDVATKVKAALNANEAIVDTFVVDSVAGLISLTAITTSVNDATLAFGFVDTDSTGVTFGASTNASAVPGNVLGTTVHYCEAHTLNAITDNAKSFNIEKQGYTRDREIFARTGGYIEPATS